MKRVHHLLAGSFVIAVVAATVFAQRRAAEAPRTEYERAVLQAQIERLEARIAKLEEEVRALRKQREVVITPQVPGEPGKVPEWKLDLVPAPGVPGQPLPPGWQKREFNGLPIYVVPLEKAGGAPTTRPVR